MDPVGLRCKLVLIRIMWGVENKKDKILKKYYN